MFQSIWQENKQFLLLCGGGLVMFLCLNSCISGYVRGAESKLAASRKLESDIRLRHKELVNRYWDEIQKVSSFERHEAALREEVCLPPDVEIKDPKSGALLIAFNKAVDDTWKAAQDEARKRGLQLPEKLTSSDFDLHAGDGPAEFQRCYSYLAILRQALLALVSSGMTRIDRPQPLPEDPLPVAQNDGLQCNYRAVSFTVTGPFESFVKVLQLVQEPKSFLQVRLNSLAPSGAGEQGLLRGRLVFVGFRFEEAPLERRTGRSRR
jgi:hypothetical protein